MEVYKVNNFPVCVFRRMSIFVFKRKGGHDTQRSVVILKFIKNGEQIV